MKSIRNESAGFDSLDTVVFSRMFKNVKNSYKFYWLLAILDHLNESEDSMISLDELALRMLSLVWYPLNFYKLSFGKQDSFKFLAIEISSYITVDNRTNAPSLYKQVQSLPKGIADKLKYSIKIVLRRWVTFRFLSPFYPEQLKGVKDQRVNKLIKDLSNDDNLTGYAPYKISEESIVLSENWKAYFENHQTILRGFIKFHLLEFLQMNNPTVIGLTEKLEKPHSRDLNLAKLFWEKYLKSEYSTCIYSNIAIPGVRMSLDHFIPWSYVAHNKVWNIIPTTKSVNSAKSNSLPDLDLYLDPFCRMHFRAVNFHVKANNQKELEDYYNLFRVSNLDTIDETNFVNILRSEITNNHRVAENLGFKPNFRYRP
jgi:hypothetical protein